MLCLLLLPWMLAAPGLALEPMPPVSAQAAVVYDPASCQFLYDKAGDAALPMASTTKIMTALVVLEQLPLEKEHVIRPEWTGVEGSSMYLKAGERLTTRELLDVLLLLRGNDAAVALACLTAGSEEAFVRQMNERAAVLGLHDTHFASASGLDGEGHYTTARDLARLAAAAMENQDFARIVGQKYASAAGRQMKNHNKLLFASDEVRGIKTGYTKKAGRCLVSAMERQGRLLIAVTLNDPDDWQDHLALYEKAYAGCQRVTLLESGPVGQVNLFSGRQSQASLYCQEGFSAYLSPEEAEQAQVVVLGPRFACAPVEAGAQYGMLQVRLGQGVLFETPVYYGQNVASTLPPAGNFFTRLWRMLAG